jgi:pyrroline-5-carboxylate reductase
MIHRIDIIRYFSAKNRNANCSQKIHFPLLLRTYMEREMNFPTMKIGRMCAEIVVKNKKSYLYIGILGIFYTYPKYLNIPISQFYLPLRIQQKHPTKKMKILIIGGGNMGMTYAESFLRSHIAKKQDMMILEKSPEKAAELAKKDIGTIYGTPETCLESADLIILAVKPQDTQALFQHLRPFVSGQQVFLSIMAGVKMSTISAALGVKKIIRAMPNLPAQIGLGMTVFTCSDEVTRIELAMVQNLLNTTGKTIYVEKETMIDASTAISGSGPAYVFYFMDAMMQAARGMNFSETEAEILVTQTFQGAVELYTKSNFTCAEWISKVASKGGTTEAALKSFDTTHLYKDIVKGAIAAQKRAIELGKD